MTQVRGVVAVMQRVPVAAAFAALLLAFVAAAEPVRAASCASVRSDLKQADMALNRALRDQADGQRNAAASLAAAAVTRLNRVNQAVFYGSAPQHACLDDNGRMRLVVLNSKANVLAAARERTSAAVKSRLELQHRLIAAVVHGQGADPASLDALNQDLRTIHRRYDDLAGKEAARAARAAIGSTPAPLASLPSPVASTPSPSPAAATATPVACARPNAPAIAIRVVEPDTPPIAAQQGIVGTVEVLVSLDADSRVIGTRIGTSPSAILNQAALAAARKSQYRTEIRDCMPVPSDFVFRARFAKT